jgi:hypothetical protein
MMMMMMMMIMCVCVSVCVEEGRGAVGFTNTVSSYQMSASELHTNTYTYMHTHAHTNMHFKAHTKSYALIINRKSGASRYHRVVLPARCHYSPPRGTIRYILHTEG